ncbi:MAG TPA: hypothetical protein VF730_04025 [Terracidiphilus sp.]
MLKVVVAAIIALMVLPPLFDTFDTWDKRPEFPVVGHNTETTLAAMALEAGMGLAVGWLSVLLLNWVRKWLLPRIAEAGAVARAGVRATDYLLLLFSPPPWETVTLRI